MCSWLKLAQQSQPQFIVIDVLDGRYDVEIPVEETEMSISDLTVSMATSSTPGFVLCRHSP